MWKAANRPNNQISQTYNDGFIRIYNVTDSAEAGKMPVPRYRRKVTLRYAERTLGVSRYYAAMQNQISISRVVRVQDTGRISTQDVAIAEDGTQYRVDLIQRVDGVYPASADLTLSRITQKIEVCDEMA